MFSSPPPTCRPANPPSHFFSRCLSNGVDLASPRSCTASLLHPEPEGIVSRVTSEKCESPLPDSALHSTLTTDSLKNSIKINATEQSRFFAFFYNSTPARKAISHVKWPEQLGRKMFLFSCRSTSLIVRRWLRKYIFRSFTGALSNTSHVLEHDGTRLGLYSFSWISP